VIGGRAALIGLTALAAATLLARATARDARA
jgi:hypothetical protein